MSNRKTPQSKPARQALASAEPETKAAAKTDLKQQVDSAIERIREQSRRNMLAGLGLMARMRQQREERMAELVEAGKRFEPKFKGTIEELKAKLQPSGDLKDKLDLSKFKVDAKAFDREAIKSRFDERMTEALHRFGLPTRKEVDELARKVDKLAELQRA